MLEAELVLNVSHESEEPLIPLTDPRMLRGVVERPRPGLNLMNHGNDVTTRLTLARDPANPRTDRLRAVPGGSERSNEGSAPPIVLSLPGRLAPRTEPGARRGEVEEREACALDRARLTRRRRGRRRGRATTTEPSKTRTDRSVRETRATERADKNLTTTEVLASALAYTKKRG